MTSWRDRLDRADEHLETVRIETRGFLDSSPYEAIPLVVEQELDEREVEYQLTVTGRALREPSARLGHVIGDFVNALRSSLDQLAYTLAGGDAAPHPDATEFPVFYSQGEFDKVDRKGNPARGSGLYKLRGAAPDVQAAIRQLQPFNTSDTRAFVVHAGPPAVKYHKLYILHELRRQDFHRRPHFTGAASGPGMLHTFSIYGGPSISTFVDLVPGVRLGIAQQPAIIATSSWRTSNPPPEGQRTTLEFLFDVAFDPGGPGLGRSVYLLLAELRDHVRDVVFPRLEVFL